MATPARSRLRPALTRARIVAALCIAVAADIVQLVLGPLGWIYVDEAIDLGVMIAESLLVGFHPLLLPTFVVEVIPVIDMLPTWTACTMAVIALRRRAARADQTPIRHDRELVARSDDPLAHR
jgi:hypothetical protein